MRIQLFSLVVTLLAGCSSQHAVASRHGDTDAATTADAGNDAAPSVRAACASNGSGALVTEAGFIDVPAGAVSLLYPERLFYSFHPADAHPENAPLLVFVNGGPTTEIMLPYGTGPETLAPDAPSTAPPRPNPNTYTRFANLLHLDQRDLGFSYATAPIRCGDAPTKESITTASDLVFATLAFLDGHPALRANPVAFVGESFGGALAPVGVHMTQMAATASSVFPDLDQLVPWLTDRLRQHGVSAFSGCADESTRRRATAAQFAWQVLLEPGLDGVTSFQSGGNAITEQLLLDQERADPDIGPYVNAPGTSGDVSQYDVRRSFAEDQAPLDNADAQIQTPASLAALLGVDVGSISGLAPDSGRVRGYRGAPSARSRTPLDELLGPLQRGDTYWAEQLLLPSPVAVDAGDGGVDYIPLEASVVRSLEGCVGQVTDLPAIDAFQANLETVHTLVTHSRYDAQVYTKALPAVLQTYGWDVVPPAIWDRTGVLRVRKSSAEPYVSIRMPTYEAGHEITIRAPKELGDDLEAWLRETGAIAG